MRSIPFFINEVHSGKRWLHFRLSSTNSKAWYTKVLEGVESIFHIPLASLSATSFKLFHQSGLVLNNNKEVKLLSGMANQSWKAKVPRLGESVLLGMDGASPSPGLYHIDGNMPALGLVKGQERGSNTNGSQQGQNTESKETFHVKSLLDSIDRMQLHEKPNKRLDYLYRVGALGEEVESLLETGLWEYSPATGTFFCTDFLYTLLNIPAAEEVLDSFESLLPYFVEHSREELVNAWYTLVNEGKVLNLLAEIRGGDQITWVRVKGKPVIKNGKVTKLVGSVQNVTDYVEREKALKAEKEKADRAAQMKAEFVSYISHEVRTPLNAIMGLTYLLLQADDVKEEHRENLNSIHFSSQNLLALINNTLDYSKIEAGKVELEKVNFHLKDLLKNTYQTFGLRSAEKKIGFDLSIDPRTPSEVAGDPVRLMQILNNLISNAIKFTDRGSVKLGVEVIYQTDKEWVLEFSVADTGIGIPKERQSRIFESFVQVNAATHRKYGGTGLGLAITKNLVELHKGSIQLQSTPGKGSVFTVRLRFTKPQASLVTVPKNSCSKIACTKLRGSRILVVDDNAINRTVATKLLTNWQVEVDTAEDGVSALEKIHANVYDLVLMDLYMPVLDGFQTVTEIRDAGLQVPVIALTGNASEEERRRVLEAGVNDYLMKPFVPQDLFNKLLQHLDTSRAYA